MVFGYRVLFWRSADQLGCKMRLRLAVDVDEVRLGAAKNVGAGSGGYVILRENVLIHSTGLITQTKEWIFTFEPGFDAVRVGIPSIFQQEVQHGGVVAFVNVGCKGLYAVHGRV